MGRLSTLRIRLTLGAWGSATDGAPYQDPSSSPPATSARPPLPPGVQPGQYVKTAVSLYQKGDNQTAATYAKAAAMYRDMLSPDDAATLDKYQSMIDQVRPSASPTAPGSAMPAPGGPDAAQPEPPTRGGTADSKQKARWLLQAAREQIRLGNLDEAAAKVAEADSYHIKWGLFDDTPTKVNEWLAKARAASIPVAAAATAPATKGDKKAAKVKLKEARTLLASGQYDKAEAVATEVNGWGLNYGMFEDSPIKVVAAARSVRQRDAIRKIGPKGQPSQDIYEIQVREARAALSLGRLDEAESKARMAQSMNVVPSLTADRAEAVLHDVAMARRTPKSAPTPAGEGIALAGTDSPSATAEREADALLSKGQDQMAAAKFAESQRLQSGQMGGGPATGDMAVVQAQAPSPTPAPAPAADPFGAPPAAEPAPNPAPAADPPAPAPVPAAEPAPGPAPASSDPAPAGPSKLEQAKALMMAGNFADARTIAQQYKVEGGDPVGADEMLAQIGLAEQAGSLRVYEASLDSLRKGDTARARDLLTQLTTAELDEATMQKVQDLLARMPKEAAGKANVGIAEDDAATVNAQRMNAEVGTRVGEARRLMETDPDKAIELLNKTLASVKAAGLSDQVTRVMCRRVEVAIELAKKDKVSFEQKMKDKEYRAEIERKRLRILLADKAKKERIKSIMEKAQAAYAEGKYEDAESLAKTAGEIDPMDVGPVALATVARYKRRYETDLVNKADKEDGAVRAFQEVDRISAIPREMNDKGIRYEQGFKALSDNRMKKFNESLTPRKDAKTMQYEAKLNEPVSINFEKRTLSEAVNFLSSYTGLNIVLDPTALAEAGLVDTSPVDLKVNNIKLKSALKLMLRPLGLTYAIRDEVLLITNPQVNRSDLVTRYHYVGDLVMTPKSQVPSIAPNGVTPMPNADANVMRTQATGVPGMPGSNGSMGATTNPGDRPIVTDQDFAPLINLIKNTIAPNTWRADGSSDKGGMGYGNGAGYAGGGGDDAADQAIGSITPFFLNISLIIRHTPEVHDEIVDLLRQLRRLQDLQVSIEVRFITVSDSFFEQIGIDFDFAIESNTVGKKTSFAQYLPGAGNLFNSTNANTTTTTSTSSTTSPYVAVNPVLDGSLGAKVPVTVGLQSGGAPQLSGRQSNNLSIPFNQSSGDLITPFNATPGAGATFGIAFLSDLEVYLFITAAQGDTRSNLVQAPKVTTFNGAAASINSANQIYYISSLTPIVGAGSVAFSPSIGVVNDGVFLNVTPVVSADRRYVRLSMAPNFNTFNGFTTLTVPAAVGGGGLGGTGTSVNGTVQLPNISNNSVNTTVTVPDGGTVLLGGVKRLQETRTEYGVPILSKTPLINRLFRNIGIGRTTDSLMLMVTPRIIILEEEEERLGIPAVATP